MLDREHAVPLAVALALAALAVVLSRRRDRTPRPHLLGLRRQLVGPV